MELSPKSVSVVIPTLGKRQNELEAIKCALGKQGFEDIICIKDTGLKLYNRKFGASFSRNDWIYTQDDDCLVKNIDILLKNADINKIVANTQEKQREFYAKEENGGGRVALIGWGAIFHKSLFDKVAKFEKDTPQDELFLREFDRVFTWFNDKILIDGEIEHFETAKDKDVAMALEKRHWDDLHNIINRLKEYEKNSIH